MGNAEGKHLATDEFSTNKYYEQFQMMKAKRK